MLPDRLRQIHDQLWRAFTKKRNPEFSTVRYDPGKRLLQSLRACDVLLPAIKRQKFPAPVSGDLSTPSCHGPVLFHTISWVEGIRAVLFRTDSRYNDGGQEYQPGHSLHAIHHVHAPNRRYGIPPICPKCQNHRGGDVLC